MTFVERGELDSWRPVMGPPVPVRMTRAVFEELLAACRSMPDPAARPRVFRLFMERGKPRRVVLAVEIEDVWRGPGGVLRWNERGYPPLSEPLRKGGNAIMRGDCEIGSHDAWWMGREQTDLRVLLQADDGDAMKIAAVWARAGTSSNLGEHETDGDLWPVSLLVESP